MKIGSFVKSTTGRDSGKYYIVVSFDNEFCYLVNGETKKQSNPKKKNIHHIEYLKCEAEKISEKLENKIKVFDSEIYSAIKNFKLSQGDN